MGIQGVPIPTSDIIEALKKNQGKVMRAARALKCTASCIWARAQREPEIKAELDRARKEYDTELLETACDSLLELVKDKEQAAVFFALKTKGRHLGFDQDDRAILIQTPFKDKGSMESNPDASE